MFDSDARHVDIPMMAREIVREYGSHTRSPGEPFDIVDVMVVWFSYTLGNWKALCTTTRPDKMYYEVTYNKAKSEVYVDSYFKISNQAVQIGSV